MELLYKKRKSVDGKKVDFFFLEDSDFKMLMLGDHREFLNEHKEGNINAVLVGYPSFNSVMPAGIDFSIDFLREIFPDEISKQSIESRTDL